MAGSDKESVIQVAEEAKPAKPKPIPIGNMFRFLPDSLRPAITSTGSIILPSLPPEPPKLPSDPKFPRIPIGIFHDGTPPTKTRSGTVRERVGKLVYMNSKPNHGVYLPVLYGEYGEVVKKKYVIFDENFASASQREAIHNKMLHTHEKIRKDHYEEKLKIVRK